MPAMRVRIGKPDPAAFGKRLNELLDRKGAPPMANGRGIWVADRYRVKPPSAHAWLHGKSVPEPQRARAMARDLGVSYDYLLFGDAALNDSANFTPNEHSGPASQGVGLDSLTMALQTAFGVLAPLKYRPRPAQYAAFVKALHDEYESGRSEAQVLQFARRMASVLSTGGQDGSGEDAES